MADPLSRRTFAAVLAGAAGAGALAAAENGDDARDPLVAPVPPERTGLRERAELQFEVLLSQFPETRIAAKREEIVRQLRANAYYGAVLADAGLSNADGPGPLWAAYRAIG